MTPYPLDDDSSPMPLEVRGTGSAAQDYRKMWKVVLSGDRRLRSLEEAIPKLVANAVKEGMPGALLTAEERAWVQLAIKRESQSIAFRRAIIEKTLTALVWAMIVGLGAMALDAVKTWAMAHGWKP